MEPIQLLKRCFVLTTNKRKKTVVLLDLSASLSEVPAEVVRRGNNYVFIDTERRFLVNTNIADNEFIELSDDESSEEGNSESIIEFDCESEVNASQSLSPQEKEEIPQGPPFQEQQVNSPVLSTMEPKTETEMAHQLQQAIIDLTEEMEEMEEGGEEEGEGRREEINYTK